jgi:hypothetical protein
VGHSRGGEAVGHASFFNRLTSIGPVPLDGSAGLGPYRFGLSPSPPSLRPIGNLRRSLGQRLSRIRTS